MSEFNRRPETRQRALARRGETISSIPHNSLIGEFGDKVAKAKRTACEKPQAKVFGKSIL